MGSFVTVDGFATSSVSHRHPTCRRLSSPPFSSSLQEKRWGENEGSSNSSNKPNSGGGGVFGAITNFFEELDAFVDDATARRLGNGAQYYGKRKSSFYGSND